MNTEPTNLFYYGSIIVMLLVFAYVDYYFFRNTIKERNWKMFVWVGAIGLLIVGWMLIVKYVL